MYLEPQCGTDSYAGGFTGEARRGPDFGIWRDRGRRKVAAPVGRPPVRHSVLALLVVQGLSMESRLERGCDHDSRT